MRGVGVPAARSPGEMANELGLRGMDSWVPRPVPEEGTSAPLFYCLEGGLRVEQKV